MNEKIKNIYNTFDELPCESLEEFYLECRSSLINEEYTLVEYLTRKIEINNISCCQLISGHSGCGKTTDLLKLKKDLEKEGYFVVFCRADELINIYDFHYVDLLLALLKRVTEEAEKIELILNYNSLGDVNLSDLKDMIPFKSLNFILKFSMISDYIKVSTYLREKTRSIFDAQAYAFIGSIKNIIDQVRVKLDELNFKDIVIIVDGLDHSIVANKDEISDLDQLLINNNNFLKELQSKILITIPVDLVFSEKEYILREIWGDDIIIKHLLPVLSDDDNLRKPSCDELKAIIDSRLSLIEDVDADELDENIKNMLAYYSGGNIGALLALLRECCVVSDSWPIDKLTLEKAVKSLKKKMLARLNTKQLNIMNKIASLDKRSFCYKYNKLLRKNYLLLQEEPGQVISVNPLFEEIAIQ